MTATLGVTTLTNISSKSGDSDVLKPQHWQLQAFPGAKCIASSVWNMFLWYTEV